jgi:hypothetical protein
MILRGSIGACSNDNGASHIASLKIFTTHQHIAHIKKPSEDSTPSEGYT